MGFYTRFFGTLQKILILKVKILSMKIILFFLLNVWNRDITTSCRIDGSQLTIPSIVNGKRIDSILNFDKNDKCGENKRAERVEECEEIRETSLLDVELGSHKVGGDWANVYLNPYIEETEKAPKKKPIFR